MEKASWWNEKLWNSRFPGPSPDGGIHYTTQNARSSQGAEGTGNGETSEEIAITPSTQKSRLFDIQNAEPPVASSQLSFPQSFKRQSVSRPVISSFRPATPNRQRPLGALRILYLSRPPTASGVGELTNRCMDVCRWSIDTSAHRGDATNSTGSAVKAISGQLSHQDCGDTQAMDKPEIPTTENIKLTSKLSQNSNQSGEPSKSAFKENKRILFTQNSALKTERNSFSALQRSSSTKILQRNKFVINDNIQRLSAKKQPKETFQDLATAVSCFPSTDETTQQTNIPLDISIPLYGEQNLGERSRTGSAEPTYSWRRRRSASSWQEFDTLEGTKKGTELFLSVTPIVFQSPKANSQIIVGPKTEAKKPLASTFRLHRDSALLYNGKMKQPTLGKSDSFQQNGTRQVVHQDENGVKRLEGEPNLSIPPSSLGLQKFSTATMFQRIAYHQRKSPFQNELPINRRERLINSAVTTSSEKSMEKSLKKHNIEEIVLQTNKPTLADAIAVENEPVVCDISQINGEYTGSTERTADLKKVNTPLINNIAGEELGEGDHISPIPSDEGGNGGSKAPVSLIHEEEGKTEVPESTNTEHNSEVLPLCDSDLNHNISGFSAKVCQHQNQRLIEEKLSTIKGLFNRASPLFYMDKTNDQAKIVSPEQTAVTDTSNRPSDPLITETPSIGISQEKSKNKMNKVADSIEEQPFPDFSPETPPSVDEEECEEVKRWDFIESLNDHDVIKAPITSFLRRNRTGSAVEKPPVYTPKIQVKSILKRPPTAERPPYTDVDLVDNQQPSTSQPSDNNQTSDKPARLLSRRTSSARPCGGRMMQLDEASWVRTSSTATRSAATCRGLNATSAKAAGQRSSVRFDMKNNLIFEFHPLDFVHNPHT